MRVIFSDGNSNRWEWDLSFKIYDDEKRRLGFFFGIEFNLGWGSSEVHEKFIKKGDTKMASL